jgi:Fanconi anemia group M protein
MQERIGIIVDQRERNAELVSGLENLGCDISFKTAPVGDYIISDRVCIERKTVSDFEGSIMNGRLFDQLERLKETYELPIVLLEGDRETFRLKRNVINGTVVAVYIDYGIPVLFSEGPANTAEIIATIAKREQGGKRREPSLKGAARAYTDNQFQEYMVGNLPGVGPMLAKSLLKHFGSVRAIANADIKELVKVEKIGKVRAQMIHNTLNHSYEHNPGLLVPDP